jgi:hypothetical protein
MCRLILRYLGRALAGLVVAFFGVWALGALHFDLGRGNAAIGWVFAVIILAVLVLVPGWWQKLGVLVLGFSLILCAWSMLQPRANRAWQPDVAQTPYADIKDDEATIHNVRNCDYRSESDYTPHWETRTVRLSQITAVDLAITYWGSPWIAHPIASFQFADTPPLCFSIETRKEIGESYSAIGGLYRQYELIYVAADERDVLRLRTNFRPGEDVYLYRTALSPAQARQRFLEYVRSINELHTRPRWYNALTTNCTTNIRSQHPPGTRMPWDWRLLLNGKGDELMFERGMLITDGLPFAELKRRARINERAHAAGDSPAFSALIRVGAPGYN